MIDFQQIDEIHYALKWQEKNIRYNFFVLNYRR